MFNNNNSNTNADITMAIYSTMPDQTRRIYKDDIFFLIKAYNKKFIKLVVLLCLFQINSLTVDAQDCNLNCNGSCIKFIGGNSNNGIVNICNGDSTILYFNPTCVSNLNNFTYQWQIETTPNNWQNIVGATNDSITVYATGTYQLVISGTGSNNCISKCEIDVAVNPIPTAAFTYSPNSGCPRKKRKVFFTSTSTINPGTLTYQWNFGDPNSLGSNTSTNQNPTHNFVGVGSGVAQNFTVQLIVTSNKGCKDTISQVISFAPFPDATLTDPINQTPFTLCGSSTYDLTVLNSSSTPTINTLYEIKWGDNTTWSGSTMTTLSHTYPTQGYFNLLFIVSSSSCKDSAEYTVYIGSNPAITFGTVGSTLQQCLPAIDTFLISGTQSNPPGTVYTAFFNDGSDSVVFAHPPPPYFVHTFSTSSCGASGCTKPNTFFVKIIAENPCGYSEAQVAPITTVKAPIANFSILPDTINCINTNVTFTNTSFSGSVIVQSGSGSNATFLCDSSNSVFWSIASVTGVANSWTVSGNLGTIPLQVGSQTISVNFSQPGTYSIQLIVRNTPNSPSLCRSDTITKIVCIQSPPTPSFTTSAVTGCAPFTVDLTNTSTNLPTCGAVIRKWIVTKNSFICSPTTSNDYTYVGGTDSTSNNPSIRFNNQGIYSIRLSLTNKCGTFTTPASNITVKSKPQFSLNSLPTICSGGATTPGASLLSCGGTISTYSWSFPGGTPSTSNQQNPGTVTYSTPGNYTVSLSVTNECGTTTATTPITVNAPPAVTTPDNQTVCNGSLTTPITFAGTATSYAWVNNTPSIGLAANGTGNIPPFIAVNNGSSPITATITVTPISSLCNGTPITFTITVNPAATVQFSAGNQTICSGSQTTAVSLTSATAAVNITWTAIQPAGITGVATSGTTTIPVQTLTNTTNAPITVNFIATATTGGNVSCPGSSFTYSIVVNPISSVNQPTNYIFCNGAPTSLITFTGSVSGTIYSWANDNTAIGLPASGNGNIPVFTATNSSNAPITATITVTPTNTINGVACIGSSKTFTITVNPTPVLTAPSNVIVCNGASTSIITFVGSISGAVYNWSNNNTAIGLAASGIGNIPAFTATNSSNAPITATIIVTASYSNGSVSCAGTPKTFVITVNPTPIVTQPINVFFCNAAATSVINFASNVAGTTYSWSNDNTAIGLAASGTNSIATFTATNTGSSPITANITVTPNYSNGSVSCSGTSKTFTITINPTPTINQPLDLVYCNGSNTSAIAFAGTIVGTTYTWTNNNTAIGLAASGTGNIPVFSATNSGNAPITATITVTPVFVNGTATCTGSAKTFTIVINPTPVITQPIAVFVCNGASTSIINFNSSVTGTTYAWTNSNTGIGLAASGSTNIPVFTAVNTGNIPVTATITVTPTYSSGSVSCNGSSKTFVITVNPTPTIAAPSDLVVCRGSNTGLITFSGNVSGTTYSWSNSNPAIGLAANGNGNIPSFVATNSTSAPILATITITPNFSNGGTTCSGVPATFTITVNPAATVQFSSPNQTICSGDQTSAVDLTSTTAGVNITWTCNPPAGITGAATSGTTSIPIQTLTNNTNAPITVNYVSTATTTGSASCPGAPTTYSIIVNPKPALSQPADMVVCNGSGSALINFTSAVVGATFSWTNNNPSIGLLSSGVGNIPSFTATNSSNAPVIATITVTANYLNGGITCSGAPLTFTITVNPTPVVTQPSNVVVCNNSAVNAMSFGGSLVTGTTYSWVNDNTSIGLAANGTGDINSFTAINNGTTTAVATIIVTPNFSNAGLSCSGLSKTFSITVNPTPQVSQPANIVICNGGTVSPIAFSGTVAGTQYSWSNDNNTIGLATNGIGNIASFIATNSSNVPVIATITVTPDYSNAGLSCSGPSKTFTITVNPTPTVTQPLNQVVCNGATISQILLGGSAVSGTTYFWVNDNTSIGLAASGTGNINSFTATNTGTTTAVATIKVTPEFTNGGISCAGSVKTFTITVNPAATVQFSSSNQTICSNSSTAAISLNSSTPGVSISWVSVQPVGITGVATSGTTSIPVQTLVNSTNAPITVDYIATATTTGSASCPGSNSTYSITVNPKPDVIANPVSETICSNTSTNISLSSNVSNTVFNWTVSANPNVSGASNSSGNAINQILINNSNSIQIVTYTITPSYTNNSITCFGNPITVSISINPTPTVTNNILTQTICSAATSTVVTLSSNVSGATFVWTATAPFGLSGFTPNGTSTIPSETIINTSTTVLTVTYEIVATANGCSGAPVYYTIHVNPKPAVTNSPLAQVICSGNSTTLVTLTSSSSGTNFTWTAIGTLGLSGYLSSGTGIIPVQTIANSTSSVGTVTYTITPFFNGCPGDPVDYIISVNPSPAVQFSSPDQTICSNTTSALVNLTSATAGVNISWVCTPPANISGAILFGTNTIPPQTLINTSNAPITISYIATATTSGTAACAGASLIYNITVNPSPVIQFSSPDQSICSGTSTSAVNLTSTSSNVNISWTCTQPAGITGVIPSGTTIIPAQILVNTTSAPIIVTYTATATTAGTANCAGTSSLYSVTVNPTADVIATPNTQTICSNTATNIVLSSSVSGTTYSWTFITSGSVTGASIGSGNTITQTLINSSANPQTVTYTITPLFTNNGASCDGIPFNLVITVNPSASISNNPLSQVICTQSLTSPVIFTSLSAGTTFSWSTSGSSSITGFTSSGTGNLPAMPLINTSTTQASLVYSVTSSVGLCPGAPTDFTILVNPDAIATFIPTDTIKCPPFIITANEVGLQTYPLNNSIYEWYVNGSLIGTGTIFPGHTIVSDDDSVNIMLKTISLFGCKADSMSRKFYTYKLPQPSFELIDTVGCGPLSVQVSNTTPNIGLFTYYWDFGNGQTSTLPQPGNIVFLPNPTYNDTIYQVSLQVFSICDTITVTRDVRVKSKPKALFTPNRTVGCSPMNVTFTNTSLGLNNTYYWDFGDGTTFVNNTLVPVQHTFNTGVLDTFYVKLVAVNECGADSIQYAIFVSPNNIRLNLAVNGPEHFGCAPHTVAFVNNTTGASSFSWNFGDGNILTTTANIDTVYHTYLTSGNYTVTLTASNNCTDTTTTDFINVFPKPVAAFVADTYTSCQGNSVQFTNQSTGGTSFLWQFGDGATSTLVNPNHTYTTPGIYTVKLTVFSANAPGNICTDTTQKQLQVVSTLPGLFTLSAVSAPCAPFTVTFVNQNRPSVTTNWDFGDGTFGTGDSVVHTYTRAGVYNVTLTVTVPGGCTYVTTRVVTINGPGGNMLYTGGYKCYPNSVRLEVTGTNFNSVLWDFGDGTTLSTTQLVVFHNYANPGTYIPRVTLQNATGCNFLLQGLDTIKVDRIDAGFTSSLQTVCGYTRVVLNDTSNVFFGTSLIKWDFGDGNTGTGANVNHDYFISGTYQVQMIIVGVSGCTDTITKSIIIQVNSLPLVTIAAPVVKCTGNEVIFSSVIQSTDPITFTQWRISNGVNSVGPVLNYTFALPGTYTVRFIAGTANGCFDTAFHTIQINPSPIVSASANVTICLGNSTQLTATGANQYQWSPFQGLSCNTCPNPVATPTVTTPYFVTGTNTFGCSVVATTVVTVIQPFNMTVSPNDTICIGQSANLLASGATRYSWSPTQNLNNANISNPVANPSVTTSYRVVGYDGFNCFTDTAFVVVAVGKYPTVSLGPDLTLSTGTIHPLNTVIQNGPIRSWLWTPSTELSCTTCALPSAVIKKNINYIVNVKNIYGCEAADTIQIKVFCEDTQVFVPNAFTPDGDGINDVLMVRGKGIVSVKFFRIFNRWGELIFEKSNFPPNNLSFGWNGKIRGVSGPPDVFVYTAEVVCENGTTFIYKGNTSIIK